MPARRSRSSGRTGRIADNMAPIRHVSVDDRPWRNPAVSAQRHAGQDYRARADKTAMPNIGVEIKATGHVMGQHNSMMIDHAVWANMDALGPRTVDQRSGRDPRGGMDVHLPEMRLHKSLPALFERSRWGFIAEMICHALDLQHRCGAGNADFPQVSE